MKEIIGELDAKGLSFGIVVSRFNSFFTEQLLLGATDCLVRHGCIGDDITVARVPGAAEIPMAVKRMALCGKFNAVLALGCVIQGATPHAELINTQVSRALSSIALDTGVPVLSGLVSANNLDQAVERSGTKAGNKGWDAAIAAIEMVSLLSRLP